MPSSRAIGLSQRGAGARCALLAVLAALLFSLGSARPTLAADEPAWVAEKEEKARALVREGSVALKAWLEGGSAGPRDFAPQFREAEQLLAEISAEAPSARRLYGLAYVRVYLAETELAHFTCERLKQLFPSEEGVIGKCEALTTALRDELFKVRIDSEPTGATVTVASWPEGNTATTPTDLWLRSGRHVLVFRSEGYLELRQDMQVEAGFVTQVKAQLRPVPVMGNIALRLEPADARVEVDGVEVAVPPDGRIQAEVGERVLRVFREGYRPEVARVVVSRDELREESFYLDAVDPTAVGGPFGRGEGIAPEPPDIAPWGWTMFGLGVATMAGGGVFHFLAAQDASDAAAVPNLPEYRGEFASRRDSAREKEMAAYIMYGVGGLVATGGVLMVVLNPAQDAPEDSPGKVVPLAYPGGGGVTWTGSF